MQTTKYTKMTQEESQPGRLKGLIQRMMCIKHIEKTFKMKKKINEVVEEVPTDCFGDINFKETTRQSMGKFIRISDNTNPQELFDLMTNKDPSKGWGLEKPRLLISVAGGAKSFIICPHLKKDFQDGLAKVASTPGAWVISGGTNLGVMKMVGEANSGSGNTCIGIAFWGIIAEKESLMHVKGQRSYDYHLETYLLQDRKVFLDYNHSHFLLVDNGSEGKSGDEIEFRGRFEDFISKANVPTVLLVLQGGSNTLQTVYNTSANNLIPCVLIKGSGGAADVLVYALAVKEEIENLSVGDRHKGLLKEIAKLKPKDANSCYNIVLECLKVSEIFTIADYGASMDTDDAILTAILGNKKCCPSHYVQVLLTILWDRVDLADLKVLAPLHKWNAKEVGREKEEFNRLMIIALAMNRTDFVKLLHNNGVSVKSALTKQVLEFLYYCYSGSLRRADITPELMGEEEPQGYKGLFLNLLSYDAVGDRRPWRERGEVYLYRLDQVQERLTEMLERVPESHVENIIEIDTKSGEFVDPYRQLFMWAVMNNLLDMALFFLEFLNEDIASALIASEIIHNMMNDTRFQDLNISGKGSLEETSKTFSQLSIDLMDSCFKANEEETEIIVTNRLQLFDGKSSCLEFAVATEQEDFVAHPAIQGLLEEVWYGSIKATDTSLWMVFATIICPFLLVDLHIRSKEEIDQMNEGADSGDTNERPTYKQRVTATKRKGNSPGLPFWKKFVNFHLYSPVVRFFEHTIAYMLFLMFISYVAMLKKTTTEESWAEKWAENVVSVTVVAFLVQEIYQLFHVDPSASLKSRLLGYLLNVWNLFDLLCIIVFIIAITLRNFEETLEISQLFYGVDVSLWIVRLINVLYVDTVAGPYVVMIGEMIGDMFKFLIILLIFLLSYGIGVKAILCPSPGSVQMLSQTIFHPYFHIHGEYFFEEDPSSDTTVLGTPKTNNWQEPIALFYMGVYLLITNILLLNLLIAIFNNTYERVISNSSRIWKFRRYELVVEYAERRTFLCPPFSLIHHIAWFVWFFLSKCCPNCFEGPSLGSGLKQNKELDSYREKELQEFERHYCVETMKKREDEEENAISLETRAKMVKVMRETSRHPEK